MQGNLNDAAKELRWAPPTDNSMPQVLRTVNYNATVTATTTFHIPTKLRKLHDPQNCCDSRSEFDTGYCSMHVAHDPHVIVSALFVAEIQTLTPQHIQYDAPSIICTDGMAALKRKVPYTPLVLVYAGQTALLTLPMYCHVGLDPPTPSTEMSYAQYILCGQAYVPI
jgi:hypothetical protein